MASVALHWFINDLRLTDNPAFCRASMADRLLCVYVHPTVKRTPFNHPPGPARAHFVQQALSDLDHRLRAQGQQLLVLEGEPVTEISRLIEQHKVSRLTVNEVCTIDEQAQLAWVENLCPHVHIDMHAGAQLLSRAQLSLPRIPASFTPFRKQVEPLRCRPVLAAPPSLPSPPAGLAEVSAAARPLQCSAEPGGIYQARFQGGESAGQAQLARLFAGMFPRHYKARRDQLDGWDNSTKLSPWFAIGCISPVQVWWQLQEWQAREGQCESSYWIGFELLWREFFHHYARDHGSRLFRFAGVNGRRPLTSFYPARYRAWCEGATSAPLVNAIMHQLRDTGYISNRARQIAASYLVNELSLDWRYGASWFEQQLVDYDAAVNWGNWQYIAGVGPDPRGGRHFNLALQAERFDPDGDYVARWYGNDTLPEPEVCTNDDYLGWP